MSEPLKNPDDDKACSEFITTCFDLNDTLDSFQAQWAKYGFVVACHYIRSEHYDTLKARCEELERSSSDHADCVDRLTNKMVREVALEDENAALKARCEELEASLLSLYKNMYGREHAWAGSWDNCETCNFFYAFHGNWETKHGECPMCRARKLIGDKP
jgi:hypothetical protein